MTPLAQVVTFTIAMNAFGHAGHWQETLFVRGVKQRSTYCGGFQLVMEVPQTRWMVYKIYPKLAGWFLLGKIP